MLQDNIRYYRKQRGYSQEQIAKMLGYKSYTTIQKWEDGSSSPNIGVLDKLARILGVSITELVYGKDGSSIAPRAVKPDAEANLIAREIQSNRYLRELLEAARGATPDDLRTVAKVLRKFRRAAKDSDRK